MVTNCLSAPLLLICELHTEHLWVLAILPLDHFYLPSLVRQLLHQLIDGLLQAKDLFSHLLFLPWWLYHRSQDLLLELLPAREILSTTGGPRTDCSRGLNRLARVSVFDEFLPVKSVIGDSGEWTRSFLLRRSQFGTEYSSLFDFEWHLEYNVYLLPHLNGFMIAKDYNLKTSNPTQQRPYNLWRDSAVMYDERNPVATLK